MRAEENTEVYIDKVFSNNGTFLKTGKGTVVLNGGGTIKLSGGAKGAGTQPVLPENGDTPTSAAGQTITGLTLNTVSTNGANVDLSLLAAGQTLTWNVPFTHDPALEGEDGGLTKTGAGKLVLAQANTLTGLVKIEEGEVLAQVDGAVAPGVELGANTVLDGNALSQTLARIKGVGVCTNGMFRVTQSIAPGADGHAAGARVAVTDLTLASGASIVCTANDTGSACDLVKVTGDLVTEGAVTVDLGRDISNPLARTFAAKVAEIVLHRTEGTAKQGWGCGIIGVEKNVWDLQQKVKSRSIINEMYHARGDDGHRGAVGGGDVRCGSGRGNPPSCGEGAA